MEVRLLPTTFALPPLPPPDAANNSLVRRLGFDEAQRVRAARLPPPKATARAVRDSSSPKRLAQTNKIPGTAFPRSSTDRLHLGERQPAAPASVLAAQPPLARPPPPPPVADASAGEVPQAALTAAGPPVVEDSASSYAVRRKKKAQASEKRDAESVAAQQQYQTELSSWLPKDIFFRDSAEKKKRYTMREQAVHERRRKNAEAVLVEIRIKQRGIEAMRTRSVHLQEENDTLMGESRRIQAQMNAMLEVIARESGELDAAAVKSMQRIRRGRRRIRTEVEAEDQQLTEDVEDREREVRYMDEDVERLQEQLLLLQSFAHWLDDAQYRHALAEHRGKDKVVRAECNAELEQSARALLAEREEMASEKAAAMDAIRRREEQRDETDLPALLVSLATVKAGIEDSTRVLAEYYENLHAVDTALADLKARHGRARTRLRDFEEGIRVRKTEELRLRERRANGRDTAAAACDDSDDEME